MSLERPEQGLGSVDWLRAFSATRSCEIALQSLNLSAHILQRFIIIFVLVFGPARLCPPWGHMALSFLLIILVYYHNVKNNV